MGLLLDWKRELLVRSSLFLPVYTQRARKSVVDIQVLFVSLVFYLDQADPTDYSLGFSI